MYQLETERPGICALGYDDSVKSVIITWLINDDAVFRAMLEEQLVLIHRHAAATVIVDTSAVRGVLNDENQQWLTDNFFPRLSSSGLAALISVVPKSAIAALTNLRSFRGCDVAFDLVEVASLPAAMTRAAEYAAA